MELISIFYFMSTGIFTVRFARDCILRCVFFLTAINLVLYNQDDNIFTTGDNQISTVMFIAAILLVEPIFFINNMAKAKLFLRMKLATLQQKQMLNLLDSVPDKVLICSQKLDNMPVGVYTNHKMTQFFGSDIVMKQSKKMEGVKRKSVLNKILFKEMTDFSSLIDTG